MQELWDAILHYLNKCGSQYKLTVTVDRGVATYSIMEGNEALIEENDLKKLAVWLKVYTSWEDDK